MPNPIARFAVAVLYVALASIATGCSEAQRSRERLTDRITGVDFAFARRGQYGRFLEDLGALHEAFKRPASMSRLPAASSNFEPAYHRIELSDRDETIAGGSLSASFYADVPDAASRFSFSCAGPENPRLRIWLHAGNDAGDSPLRVLYGERELALEAPPRLQLRLYDIPVSECEDGGWSFRIGEPVPSGLLMSLPKLVVDSPDARPPAILISVDTLRADAWEREGARPEQLDRFARDAVRYTSVYSSYPSTQVSHSVLLSGHFPTEIADLEGLNDLSFVPGLKALGYSNFAFVAGGFMRSRFGFLGRAPGFALGFDLYLESYQLTPGEREDVLQTSGSEALLETHTLSVALERSLGWFRRYPRESTFHFLHGYDAHEYRTVDRLYFDRELESRADSEELARCIEESGLRRGEPLVVHHPFERWVEQRGLPYSESCQKQVLDIFYQARVRSVEDSIERYLRGLMDLGIYDEALIVLTSDHGESLLDEVDWNGSTVWGHNRILHNNLHVPLWIKFPQARWGGRRVDANLGLAHLRALIEEWAWGRLTDPAAGSGVVVRFSSRRDGSGLIPEPGVLCAWMQGREGELAVFRESAWSRSDSCVEGEESCRAIERCRAELLDGGDFGATVESPVIPAELAAELRALGYVD